MEPSNRILILHDGDRIGEAIVHQLGPAAVSLRASDGAGAADEVVRTAFGCRAIIAVGDRFAADAAVLSAANMPGVRALVVVVHTATDFTTLRKRGVPYTVLRVAPPLEDLVAELEPAIASGRLILDSDPAVSFIAADDAAACAIAAVDHDDYCGRIVELAAPGEHRVASIATAIAQARQQSLKVSSWPRWVIAGMRALGRAPFRLPAAFAARATEDGSPLHPHPWRSVQEVATSASERRQEHALGMH